MRNFKKVIALAISAAALATSVSAFAELDYKVEGLTGEYKAATNSLSLTVDGADGTKTILVLPKGVDAAEATGEDILYINQFTGEESYSDMGLKGTDPLPEGEYVIKIGYEDEIEGFKIAEGLIKVTKAEAEITIVYGDVNEDTFVTVNDASLIAQVAAGVLTFDAAKAKAADVNGDTFITVNDASLVAQKAAGVLTSFPVEQ